MIHIRLRSAVVTTAFLLFAACAGTSNTATTSSNASAAMNPRCPISGDALDGSSPTTQFQGKTVGFCCNNCIKKFDGMDAADKQAKVTGAMPPK